MYLFHNDYNQMCHTKGWDKMTDSRAEAMGGYGIDPHCENAAAMIKQKCGREDVDVHFLVGGTQANLVVTTAALRPHQAILSAESGHVNVHETGAIEATGHKVVALPSDDGKITAEQIRRAAQQQLDDDSAEHVAQIKMVYISNPTELGTTYRLSELEEIGKACREYGLYLYLDGARLAYALGAKDNDITLADYARICDVFYIGGTKCGAMFGEAVVISQPEIARDFRYIIKQRGGMLAKGWLLGLQFEALFEDDLYFKLGKRANELADKIRQTLTEHDVPFLVTCNTNQMFPILPVNVLDQLSENFTFMVQQQMDADHKAVRFCTSWATDDTAADALCDALKLLLK